MHIDYSSVNETSESYGLPKITVMGVGGGGGNVVNRMLEDNIAGVEYVVVNTDAVVVSASSASVKFAIGKKLTRGQGAGMKPEIGRQAAIEDSQLIRDALEGTDMLFIAAGMGGGTGTGAAPIIAEIAKEMQVLTVGVVTTPFAFEGKKRQSLGEQGIQELKKHVDTMMVIPNDRLLEIVSEKTTINQAFRLADDVLKQAISGLTTLINMKGLINLDFADVKTVMQDKGRAIIGKGVAKGENRGLQAAEAAISSPLLNDRPISGATGIIINIVADPNFTLIEAQAAANFIEKAADQDADVIFGVVDDHTKENEVAITVIAAGFENYQADKQVAKKQLRVNDSMKNVAVKTDAEEAEESVKESLKEPSVELVLSADEMKPIEKEVFVPEDLYYAAKKSLEKDSEIDYDIPAFIRKRY